MTISENLRNLINKNLAIFEDDINFTDEDDIFALGFVNSLFAMKIVNYIEQNFDLEVKDEELDINNFRSISRILRFIEGKVNASGDVNA